MRKLITTGALATGLAAASLIGSGVAAANDADVIQRGSCSAASDWKLKLSPEDGAIEVEFQVDQNRPRQTWHVVLSHNGTRFFSGDKTTNRRSGSFEVRKVVANLAGPDTITARATNAATGETCQGSATF